MPAPRQQQRVDQPLARDRRALDALELGAEKPVVEAGIVNHQRRVVADKGEELVGDLGKARLVLEEFT